MGAKEATPESIPQGNHPLWNAGTDLTKGAPWSAHTSGERFTHRRTVGWANYPYQYELTEFAGEDMFSLRTQPLMMSLRRVSAARIDTGLHQYSQYYMRPDCGLFAAIHHELPSPEELTEEQMKDMRAAFDFTLENDLYVPTAMDEFEVEHEMRRAYMDGVEPKVE